MLLKIKFYIRIVVSLIVIISLPVVVLAADSEAVKWPELAQHLSEKSVIMEPMSVVDCPIGIASESAEHLVCQVIENTFYKWKEYEFFTAAGELRLAIEMIKPEARFLTATEAQVLLNGSKLWEHQESGSLANLTVRQSPVNHPKGRNPVSRTLRTNPGVALAEGSVESINQLVVASPAIILDEDEKPSSRSSVHGTDDRDRVTSFATITDYPWNRICYLGFQVAGATYRGSGILISPYCVLTCGHNVWDQDLGVWSSNVTVTPAQYQAYQGAQIYEPFGTVSDTTMATNTAYGDESAGFEYDYGAVKMRRAFPGISSNFMPIEYNATPTTINTAGYPGEVQGESSSYDMWVSGGGVIGYEGINNRLMLYQIDTSGGQSGSPVWRYNKDTGRRLVAIHVFGATWDNGACRLVSSMEENISKWMAYVPEDSSVYTHYSYVPYFSTSSSRWTGLAVANYNNASNSVKVEYYAANGDPLGNERKTIAAYGQGTFTDVPSFTEGWIKVSSTAPVKGLVLIGDSAPATMFDIDLQDSLHKTFLFPHLAADQDWRSFVMICNPNPSSARISVEHRDVNGNLTGPLSITPIPANGSVNFSAYTVFQKSVTGGSLIVKTDQPVTAFLLYDNKATTWKAGLSAVPLD
ncbi:trypsin-like peptidase domain-containing protein [bacterium]|nr:trypsin-like peptidase domain-containing protein [bacterium]